MLMRDKNLTVHRSRKYLPVLEYTWCGAWLPRVCFVFVSEAESITNTTVVTVMLTIGLYLGLRAMMSW